MHYLDPFLVGDSCKSEPNLANYKTQYEINYPLRPYSPRVLPLKRAPNIKLNSGVMDIFSEQKSQFKAYPEDVVSRARPPMVKKPNNLFLTGDNQHIPEYRSSFVHHNIDSVFEHNKPTCGHYKIRNNKKGKSERDPDKMRDMPERVTRMCSSNNNSFDDEKYRYHQRIDDENNFVPEYRSQFRAVAGQRSSMIPQKNNLNIAENRSLFGGSSEYTNRYKTFEQYTKSLPVRKQDNLHVQNVKNQIQPEYTERYREVDMNLYERRKPYRRQDNLHTEGEFSREMPEYHEKYRQPHASSYPERAKGREDFLALEGEMAYSPEYRKNYVEFPRQRPIVRRPPSNVQMPTAIERERRPEKVVDLPIDVVPYHGNGSTSRLRRVKSDDSDEIPLEARPEYRKALRYNLIKERSPSRGSGSVRSEKSKSPDEKQDKNNNNMVKAREQESETTRILSQNAAKMKQDNMFNENNEVIVEPLKRPENFKIPTRSPDKMPLGKAPMYPIERQGLYKEDKINLNKRRPLSRKPMKVTIDQIDNECTLSDEEPCPPRKEFVDTSFVPPPYYHPPPVDKKKSPKFGRRATNPVENYNLRTKTSVIEANPRYAHERRRDVIPNCHERNAYHCISSQHVQPQMPQARPPAEPLATNYYQNYEINKQHNYRESLRDERNPFLVIDQGQIQNKPNSWMKKSWYDTH